MEKVWIGCNLLLAVHSCPITIAKILKIVHYPKSFRRNVDLLVETSYVSENSAPPLLVVSVKRQPTVAEL
jgi:hypothetical protein